MVGISAGTWVGENLTGDAGAFVVGVPGSTRIEHSRTHWLYQLHGPLRAAGLVPKDGRRRRRFMALEPLFRSWVAR